MKLKEQLKALADVLTDEQLVSLEEQIKTMVSEETDLRVEEKTKELNEQANDYCEQEISKKVLEEKETLIEQYDKKLEELEDTIVEKVDQFIEMEVASQISDEAIEKVAINETFKPIIEGIQHLFEEKYVALDSEGNKVLSEVKAEVKDLKEKLDEAYTEKLEMAKLAETAAVQLKISEKTEELTESQKQRVVTFFEGKSFDEVEKKIDSFVDIINESSAEETTEEETNLNEENNFSNEDGEPEKDTEEKDRIDEGKEEGTSEEEKPKYSSVVSIAQNLL